MPCLFFNTERMSDMQTKFVEANGLRFEVLEQGTGVRLALCLHGFPEPRPGAGQPRVFDRRVPARVWRSRRGRWRRHLRATDGDVTAWFDRQRSLAVSLVSAGMGVAPMTVAPIAARLVSTYDWRFSQLSIGLAVRALLLPAAFLVRRAPPAARAERRVAGAEMTVRQALTSPQFAVLAGTYFLCCATHSGPLFHTVSTRSPAARRSWLPKSRSSCSPSPRRIAGRTGAETSSTIRTGQAPQTP